MKEVDDNEFMKMVASGGNKPKKDEDHPAEDNSRKRRKILPVPGNHTSDYINTFIQRGSESEKSTVYLNKELISQLKNIMATIGGDKATLGGYVEAIIASHFEQYKDEIIRLFNENIKQPFQ
ncbi:MAG: DUF3408 domain-containing protein [Spirochaetales bacterium]|nr:DUF3408 domain-containing protein [Spirochaetales bacterium]